MSKRGLSRPLAGRCPLDHCPSLTRTSSPRRRRRWPECREHRTGSARSEGYYPISRREKARYLRPCPAPRPDPDAPDTQVSPRAWPWGPHPAVPAPSPPRCPSPSTGSQPSAVGATLGAAAAAQRHRLGCAAGQRPAQAQPAQGGTRWGVQGRSVSLRSSQCHPGVFASPLFLVPFPRLCPAQQTRVLPVPIVPLNDTSVCVSLGCPHPQ